METRCRKTTLQTQVCDVTDYASQRAVYVECNARVSKAVGVHKTITALLDALPSHPVYNAKRANLIHNEGYALRAISVAWCPNRKETRAALEYLKSIRGRITDPVMVEHVAANIKCFERDLSADVLQVVNGLNEPANAIILGPVHHQTQKLGDAA